MPRSAVPLVARRFLPWILLKSSTACYVVEEEINTFEITHPFHPLRGQQFTLVNRRRNWGEDRVFYFDGDGKLSSMLTAWTNLADTDFFLQASNGRSWLRIDDLLNLRRLLTMLLKEHQSQQGDVK